MNKPVHAATITDVAQRARVSIKTVSRVVNRETGVHEETRAAVLKVVAELNYRPKQSARSLAGARSFLIGLLYYDPSAAFIGGVQQGATHRCRDAGYHLVVESLESDAGDIAMQLDHMVSALRPDGMILTPPVCDNPAVLNALQTARIPCVLISPDADVHHLSQVRMDDVRAAEELTNLLISLGHTRIGFIKGAADQSASRLRLQGFMQAMRAHDLSPDPDLIYQGDFTFPSGVEGAHHLLSRRSAPTAVFASNDDMALGVLSTAQRLGLSVPGDLSIVGFDDSPAASLVWPSLTTVRQPLAEMASAAVDLLISREARPADPGTDVGTVAAALRVIGHDLIVRASTAAPQRRLGGRG